jgi:hypothetical protein
MEENTNPTPAKGSKTGVTISILAVIIIIAGALWYSFSGTNDNTNNANTVVNENTNVTVNENVNTTINENTNVTTNTNISTNTNSTVDTSDWETYSNEEYGYEIKHPSEIIPSDSQEGEFRISVEERDQGIKIHEIYERYTGKICVRLNYKDLGYVSISTPENDGYVLCGISGIGLLDDEIEKNRKIEIDGNTYDIKGTEYILTKPDDVSTNTLEFHHEVWSVVLDDGTIIGIISSASEEHTFEEFEQIREELFEIVKTYRKG